MQVICAPTSSNVFIQLTVPFILLGTHIGDCVRDIDILHNLRLTLSIDATVI